MFRLDDDDLISTLDLYFEKMADFGFDRTESAILLMNAGKRTNIRKIMKVVDYIEPKECGGVVRSDIDKQTALKEISKILVEE